ncbi:MAG: carbohydrate kinase family protein [Gaiellaceae bacterium]
MRITTLGDLLLDVIVRLDEPLVPGDDRMATTRTGPGGQAANVAAWAASMGAEARFVGRRGGDAAGEIVTRALVELGVEVVGPIGGRNGVVVSLASSGDRSMASDRGVAPELSAQDLEAAWFDCDVLHLSGYSLLIEPIASASEAAVGFARAHGAQVAVDLSTWTLVDDAFRARVRAMAPDVVFATEREREALGELDTRWVVKRGAHGLDVDGRSYPSVATQIVDTTGAGDALAAGFHVGGAEVGLAAAARCCARLGAMP